MKKLILSIAILTAMTFVACSEDEKDYTPNYLGCMHCAIPEEEGYEVCVDESGNAFVGNADTGIPLEQYFDLFCSNEPEEPTNPAEPGEPTDDCVTCPETDMTPEEVVCKGTNGNAFVGEQDQGVSYSQYIDLMEELTGANCE